MVGYKTARIAIFSLLLIPPVGLFYIWKFQHWDDGFKIILSVISIPLILLYAVVWIVLPVVLLLAAISITIFSFITINPMASIIRETETPFKSSNISNLYTNEQMVRYAKAINGELKVVRINKKLRFGVFERHNSSEKYRTSLCFCTCPDFTEKTSPKPCKHMYYLANELGLLDKYKSELPTEYGEISEKYYDTNYSKSYSTPSFDDSPSCPHCGGEMEVRDGKNGEFWGCIDFPDCRGTRSIY